MLELWQYMEPGSSTKNGPDNQLRWSCGALVEEGESFSTHVLNCPTMKLAGLRNAEEEALRQGVRVRSRLSDGLTLLRNDVWDGKWSDNHDTFVDLLKLASPSFEEVDKAVQALRPDHDDKV